GIGERPRARQSLERLDERLLDHVPPSMTDPVMRAQYRWSFGLSCSTNCSRIFSSEDDVGHLAGDRFHGASIGYLGRFILGSAVRRGDAGVALEAVGDPGRETRIGQKRHHVLTVLPGESGAPYRSARNASIERPRRRAPALAAW